jgi:hypothetical protein
MKLQNYVITHKESPIPKANWITPLGVGGFMSANVIESDNQYDNNISHLNKYYCELTGIFHIWKNSSADFIGISHYRRYLNLLTIPDNNNAWLSAENSNPILDYLGRDEQYDKALELLEHYDFILPRAAYSNISSGSDYMQAHNQAEWHKFIEILDNKYGRQQHSMMHERRNFFCNMMITRRSMFNQYCAELFATIDKVYEEIGIPTEIPGARYQPFRYPGYLAERFMSAFVNAHKLKVFEANVIILN